tara:strand:- start:462 stop:578 length:117 start_codon:yes stop_codon:yes gene_type:complete
MTDCIWLDLLGVFAIALGIATMMLWNSLNPYPNNGEKK